MTVGAGKIPVPRASEGGHQREVVEFADALRHDPGRIQPQLERPADLRRGARQQQRRAVQRLRERLLLQRCRQRRRREERRPALAEKMVERAQRRPGSRCVGEHDVELVLREELEQCLRGGLAADHLDVRLKRGPQHAVRDQLRHHVGDPDLHAHRPLRRPVAQRVAELAPEGEDLVRIPQRDPPRLAQHQRPPRLLEQLLAEGLLQQAELSADRRLGEIQLPRGRRNAALVRHDPEIQEVMVVQPLHAT